MKLLHAIVLVCFCMTGGMYAHATNKTLAEKVEIAKATPDKININQATLSQLQSLPGVGLKKAQAIIDYRSQHGDFTSVNELEKVKGIGKKMVAKLATKAST